MCKSQSHFVMLHYYLKVYAHPHMHSTKNHIINYADATEKHTHSASIFGKMEKRNWLSAKVCTCSIVPCNCAHTHRKQTRNRSTHARTQSHAIHILHTTPSRFPFSPRTVFFFLVHSRKSLEYILRNLMTFSRLVNIIHLSHGYWYNFYKLFASMSCFSLLCENIFLISCLHPLILPAKLSKNKFHEHSFLCNRIRIRNTHLRLNLLQPH